LPAPRADARDRVARRGARDRFAMSELRVL